MNKKSSRRGRPSSSSSTSRFVLGLALCAVFVGAWELWASSAPEADAKAAKESAIAGQYGNLLDVKTAESCLPDQMVNYTGMDLSFNPRTHQPNWVAWELTAEETEGSQPRENKFYCDENVKGCADSYDYNYSGYDRGHMAPAGDMKWSAEAMHDSFSMANICPQAKSLNTGAWKNLEEKCRQWAAIDSVLYIVCGPVPTDNPLEYIGDSRVAVPRQFFKVIIAPYASPARGIGFIMPNSRVEGGMQAAAVSIDEVERITGHDFFSSLPDDLEQEIESQCDFHRWSARKVRKK